MEDDYVTNFRRNRSLVGEQRTKKLSVESNLCTARRDSSPVIPVKKLSLPATLNTALVNTNSLEPKEATCDLETDTESFTKVESDSQLSPVVQDGAKRSSSLSQQSESFSFTNSSSGMCSLVEVCCEHSVIDLTHIKVSHTSSTDSEHSVEFTWPVGSPKTTRRASLSVTTPTAQHDSAFSEDNDVFHTNEEKLFTCGGSPPSSPSSTASSSCYSFLNPVQSNISSDCDTVLTMSCISGSVANLPINGGTNMQLVIVSDSQVNNDSTSNKANDDNGDSGSEGVSPVVSVVSLLSVLTGLEEPLEGSLQSSVVAKKKKHKTRSISCSGVPTRKDSVYSSVFNLPAGPVNPLRKTFRKSNSYTNSVPTKRF